MDYLALKAELVNDPLGRGYAAMDLIQKSVDLNTAYRNHNRASMSGDEVFAATDSGEFAALTDAKKSQWLAFCARSEIDPFSSANVAFVQYLFTTTASNLTTLRVELISRATELGLGVVLPGNVQFAESL